MKAPQRAPRLAIVGALGGKPIFAGVALIAGVVLVWWGGSTIYADAVAADLQGTRGELTPLPLLALAVGICAVVWGVCALAWRLAKALHGGDSSPEESVNAPTRPDTR